MAKVYHIWKTRYKHHFLAGAFQFLGRDPVSHRLQTDVCYGKCVETH